MKSPLTRLALTFAFVCIGSTVLTAQDDEIDFSAMSLEDLLNIEVVTASKQAESTSDAPAVISTITKQEIQQFGGLQLREILERVVGITPNRADGVYYNVAMRGGDSNPDNANAHMLLLVNGRPIRESYNGGSVMVPLSVFPVDAIERIEIVRGPGSVLYGTNAFEGVVNIITKKEEDSSFEVSGTFGTDEGQGIGVVANYNSNGLVFNIAARTFEEDGPDTVTNSFAGTPQELDNDFQDNLGIMASLEYKGFSLDYYHADTDWNAISFGPGFFPLFQRAEQTMIDLGYEHSFNDKWTFRGDVTRNENDFAFVNDERHGGDGTDLIQRGAEDLLFEATFFGNINDQVSILFGGVHENITGESSTNEIPEYDENRWSAYFQLDYRPSENVKFVVGGQYNKIDQIDGNFVPRMGGIFNFNANSGIKILYGEAFRDAAKLQSNQNFAPFGPNPNLEPETTASADVQFFMNRDNLQATFTLFRNEEEKLIGVAPFPDANDQGFEFFFDNTSGRTIEGAEIEAKYVANKNWFLQGSYVYNRSESDDGIDDITLSPDSIFKAGISYTSPSVSVGLFYSRFDAFKDNEIIFPDRVLANPVSEDWDSITLNFNYHLALQAVKLDFYVYGRNLQDDVVHTPMMETADTNTITYNLSSQFYGGIRARF